LATHLSPDPDRVFLEVINEPMVDDGYRWMEFRPNSSQRFAGAPRHHHSHRTDGQPKRVLFLEPVADRNVICFISRTPPVPHQGATEIGNSGRSEACSVSIKPGSSRRDFATISNQQLRAAVAQIR
jgi:hypothetical protein